MIADIWIADLNRYYTITKYLNKAELQQAAKFRFQRDAERFIKRRTILRNLLSQYLDFAPEKIEFIHGKFGKPMLTGEYDIRFNLSHSANIVMVGVVKGVEIGVDIEEIQPSIDLDLVSNHFFASEEIDLIQSKSGLKKTEIFFRHWTIKEAFIKAIGKGLSYPLDHVTVKNITGHPKLNFKHRKVLFRNWHVEFIDSHPGFIGSLALESKPEKVNVKYLNDNYQTH